MQALLFDKKSASHGIGTLNTLAIACTVAGGILLINTDKAEHSKSEMQQYLVVKTVKADTRRGVYNPFALASKTPILAKKSTVRDWIVTDVEFDQKPIQWFCQTSIHNNLLGKDSDRLCIHNETLVSSVAPVVFPLHSLQQSR